MPSAQEKSYFSERLWFALRSSPYTVKGATDLARAFNLQYRSGESISVQTAHKWLSGRAIPTREKITTLANWLNVTEHWLHYGPPPKTDHSKKNIQGQQGGLQPAGLQSKEYPSSPETLLLAQKIETLTEHQKYLVSEFIRQFYGRLSG
jgi:transcriptional regulator with XRE-family HTH domain